MSVDISPCPRPVCTFKGARTTGHAACFAVRVARDHRKLRVFQLADSLTVEVYRRTERFDSSETYGLRSQLRRAAASVALNIVEGASRESEGDYLRFLDIAFGSCREVTYLVDLSGRLGLLAPLAVESLAIQANLTQATIGALRKAIRAKRQ